jgi:signal transduction histidine kinase
MNGQSGRLPGEAAGLLRRLRQYILFRWVAIGVALLVVLAARPALNVRVSMPAMLGVLGASALCNVVFVIWRRRHDRNSPDGNTLRWGRRFAFAQIVTDLVALTAFIHFAGGIETSFFLFYLFHVGLASILLSRRDAYGVMALTIGLFVLPVWAEMQGWLPHIHFEEIIPSCLYQETPYVILVTASFVATLVFLTAGATSIMTELRRQWTRRADEQQREMDEISTQLEDLDRMRTFFLGLASHDLKTPLAAVTNYLQAILDGFVGDVNEKQQAWMERANIRTLELIRLINDFLDVSQLDPSRVLAEVELTTLGDIIQESIGEVHFKSEEKSIVLQVNLPPDLPPIHAAPSRLQQVITNLLNNAIECSPRHEKVVLEAHRRQEMIQLDVTDAGPDIPTFCIPHVFDDYFQAQRKEFVPGAGLGLCTARKIVQAHGGEIWVESPCFEGERGSRFSFTLPIRQPKAASSSGV